MNSPLLPYLKSTSGPRRRHAIWRFEERIPILVVEVVRRGRNVVRGHVVRRASGRGLLAAAVRGVQDLGDLYAESGQTLQGSLSDVSKPNLQDLVNTRWKALAEIYTMPSFAPFLESKFEKPGKKNLAKTGLEKVKMKSA